MGWGGGEGEEGGGGSEVQQHFLTASDSVAEAWEHGECYDINVTMYYGYGRRRACRYELYDLRSLVIMIIH